MVRIFRQGTLVPAIITLGITILRLVGELQHWPSLLFNREAGGGGAIVGISWLPLILGPYFAVKLSKSGDRPSSAGKAIGLAVLAFVVMFVGGFVGFAPNINFPGKIFVGLLVMAAGAAVFFPAWPSLAKTLLAYGINDVTLPDERGFPLQLVAKSRYGYKWAKWITKIEVTDKEVRGYWESRGYSNSARVGEYPFG